MDETYIQETSSHRCDASAYIDCFDDLAEDDNEGETTPYPLPETLPPPVEVSPSEEIPGPFSCTKHGVRIYGNFIKAQLLQRADGFSIFSTGDTPALLIRWRNDGEKSASYDLPSDYDENKVMGVVEKWFVSDF